MAELQTYGDLKKVIKSINLKQKGEKIGNIALGTIIGFIPGADAAKTTFEFIRAAISKPDTKKTGTWLDKLDIDDEMSAIVDDTVENGFMQTMSDTIESEPDDKPLEDNFNMNDKMVNYLKDKYAGRTVSGIQENKMNNLRELIRKTYEFVKFEGQDPINEVSYRSFTKTVSEVSPERKISKAILGIKKRLREINQIVDYSIRLREENSLTTENYLTNSVRGLEEITTRLTELDKKIKTLKS